MLFNLINDQSKRYVKFLDPFQSDLSLLILKIEINFSFIN